MADAEIGNLEGRDTAAHAKLEPTRAHVIKHADLLDETQRIVERQDIDQWAKPDVARPLGDSSEENTRRRRHPERGRVVLGDVIAEEAGAIVSFDQLQPVLVELPQGGVAEVHMVEYADVHVVSPTTW